MATVLSGAQVSPSGQPGPQGIPALPIGTILDYGGVAAPSGYLLCYGQAVSRTDYNQLFSAIGTTWGAGDGSTTFNVPDLRGFVTAGKDNMGGTDSGRLNTITAGGGHNAVAGYGGAQTHTLTEAQLASHGHVAYWGYYTVSWIGQPGIAPGSTYNLQHNWYNATSGTSGTGGNQPHNNVQPTRIVIKIIFTGVFN